MRAEDPLCQKACQNALSQNGLPVEQQCHDGRSGGGVDAQLEVWEGMRDSKIELLLAANDASARKADGHSAASWSLQLLFHRLHCKRRASVSRRMPHRPADGADLTAPVNKPDTVTGWAFRNANMRNNCSYQQLHILPRAQTAAGRT